MRRDFLRTTSNKVKTLVKKDILFTTFLATLKKSKISFVTKFDYFEALKRADQINSVLNIITSIVSKPHIVTTTNEIVLRSELASKLSVESFNETIKDTKLWKHKGRELIPEYVHTLENIDTIVTYENKFIARMVDFVSEEASELKHELLPLIESLEEQYESHGLGFNENSFLSKLSESTYPYQDIFTEEDGNKRKLFALVKKINKRSQILKNTNFYIQNKKEQLSFPILVTNILIHDKLYAYVYKFYKDNYLGKVKDDIDQDVDFYNYFVSNLLLEISKNKALTISTTKKAKIYLDENKNIRICNFLFSNKMFNFVVDDDLNNLGIKINVSFKKEFIKENEELKFNTLSCFIRAINTLKDSNKNDINNSLEDIKERYDNVIIITSLNEINEFNNVITLSKYKDNHELIIKNLINSLTLVFLDSKGTFVSKCPVCGNNEIKLNSLDYECESCKAKFNLFTLNKTNYMWLKTLRRTN